MIWRSVVSRRSCSLLHAFQHHEASIVEDIYWDSCLACHLSLNIPEVEDTAAET